MKRPSDDDRIARLERQIEVLAGVVIELLLDKADTSPRGLIGVQRDIYRIREARHT